MGDPSTLRLVPASSASIPIDWSRVPEATKKMLLDGWGYDWENEVQRPLPATVGDLAKMFDESKFFGYLSPKLCTILMDISELGLKPQASGVLPRFYMEYLAQVWVIVFFPGKRDGVVANSPDVIREDGSDYEEAERRTAAKEIELAQQFDTKLTQVSQGAMSVVDYTKRLCGWEASMLKKTFEYSQYVDAIQTLPISHPAYRAMIGDVFGKGRQF
ncbi:hypothetical protein AX14_004936 [Amanita brunnescens Koide BX004]|nr:hypothetical protein AX14_009630 [Amanita brunnescens Koide BX004]KAF8731428.1 hypothetical protein AX14_004936 [Amanita brunnescens Koide BX004]